MIDSLGLSWAPLSHCVCGCTGVSELATLDERLSAARSDLARLEGGEQPRLEQHLREVQVGAGGYGSDPACFL